MATILPFTIRRRLRATRHVAGPRGAAIIIFPGVRYEPAKPENHAGTLAGDGASGKRNGKS